MSRLLCATCETTPSAIVVDGTTMAGSDTAGAVATSVLQIAPSVGHGRRSSNSYGAPEQPRARLTQRATLRTRLLIAFTVPRHARQNPARCNGVGRRTALPPRSR